MRDFDGKVAVITGAASGIGAALAEAFAARGARLVLADVDAERLGSAGSRLTGAAGCETVVTDVTDPGSVAALADAAWARFGQVDVLCNNAGVFAGGVLWERPDADFSFVLGPNLWGILHGIRSFVPRMLAQGTEGHVVNTCSIAGLMGVAYCGPYTISKHAAIAASVALAQDLRAQGAPISVTAVCPGMVRTDLDRSSRDTRPPALAVPASEDVAFVDAIVADALAAGIDAAEVARQTLEAIEERRFCVLTHPHHRDDLRRQVDDLLSGAVPTDGEYR
jgi:NAD(P)-dependent dehydrogenase (short-subunit alcohol dehydrogenase family)